jgi:hypothetical protein
MSSFGICQQLYWVSSPRDAYGGQKRFVKLTFVSQYVMKLFLYVISNGQIKYVES